MRHTSLNAILAAAAALATTMSLAGCISQPQPDQNLSVIPEQGSSTTSPTVPTADTGASPATTASGSTIDTDLGNALQSATDLDTELGNLDLSDAHS